MLGAGYFLYSNLSDSSAASDELTGAAAELQTLQSKDPYPSREHIQEAKDQQKQAQELLGKFNTTFAPFPPVAKTSEKEFKSLLDRSIIQLQLAATNAGVGLPPEYSFSFSAITSKLNFPPENIEPWIVQLQEIKALCDIVYRSKVDFFESLRRVPVGDEQGGADYLGTTSVTNGNTVTTPYEIQFRAFSPEIAAVLEGFMHATNCFVIKNVDILPSTGLDLSSLGAPSEGGYAQVRRPRGRGGRGEVDNSADLAAQALRAGPAAPTVILSEKKLHVTMLVQIIKPKSPEH